MKIGTPSLASRPLTGNAGKLAAGSATPPQAKPRLGSRSPRFVSPGEETAGQQLRAEARTEQSPVWEGARRAGLAGSRWRRFQGERSQALPERRTAQAEAKRSRAPERGFQAPPIAEGESQAQYFDRFAAALSDWASEHRAQLGLSPRRGAAPTKAQARRGRSAGGARRSFSLFDPLAAR